MLASNTGLCFYAIAWTDVCYRTHGHVIALAAICLWQSPHHAHTVMFDQYNFQFVVLHLFLPKTQEVILISLHCIVGGPAMIRAAAKNHSHVAVVVDPNDYDELLEHLASGTDSQEAVQYRKRLAWKAFQHCATYDSTVAEWLWSQIGKQMHCDMKNLLQLLQSLQTWIQ